MDSQKESYESPALEVLGSFSELTQQGSDGRAENPASHATKGPSGP